jgi:hypothetical protein
MRPLMAAKAAAPMLRNTRHPRDDAVPPLEQDPHRSEASCCGCGNRWCRRDSPGAIDVPATRYRFAAVETVCLICLLDAAKLTPMP